MWALQLQLATYGTRTSFGPRGNYSQLRTLRVSVQRGLYSQLSRIIYTHTLNKHQPRVARIRKRVVTSQTMEASESNASKETYHEMLNTAYEKHHTIFRTSKFLILVRLLALIPIVLSMYLCYFHDDLYKAVTYFDLFMHFSEVTDIAVFFYSCSRRYLSKTSESSEISPFFSDVLSFCPLLLCYGLAN